MPTFEKPKCYFCPAGFTWTDCGGNGRLSYLGRLSEEKARYTAASMGCAFVKIAENITWPPKVLREETGGGAQ